MKYIVKKILISSGWYEGRNTDISEYMEWYAGEEYLIKNINDDIGWLEQVY